MDETHFPQRPPTERDTLLTPVQPYRRSASERRVIVPGFEILEELGRGGMGVVYKARQQGLNRVVAIKLLLSPTVNVEDRVRFLTEAEAVAAVKHPNVVQVYEFGESDGRPYLAMEFVDGGSLAKFILERGALSPQIAAGLVEQTARGVHAAHEQGIVHRDMKPANVLLAVGSGQQTAGSKDKNSGSSLLTAHSPLPTPKVSDFGIAKRGGASDLTQTGVAMGTPAYMSPEQARGQTKFVGPGADVYALGVILYECLTGQTPFDGTDSIELFHRVVFDDPPPVRKFAPNVPVDLELICLKCLQKWPHLRYPTAAALADDLARFLAGDPVSVRPPGKVEKVARWVRKYPTRTAAYGLATLAVVLGTLAAGALMLWRNADEARTQAIAAKGETDDALAKAEVAKAEADTARTAAEHAALQADAEREKAQAAANQEAAARNKLAIKEAEQALQKAAHDTDLAFREYDLNNLAQARRVLAGIPADYQPWETRFVRKLCQREAAVITPGELPYAASFVGGSDRVLYSEMKTLSEWDTKTSKSTEVLKDSIIRLTATTDCKRFAAMGPQTITVLERSPDRIIAKIPTGAGYAAFDHTGNKLLYGSNNGGALHDLTTNTGEQLPADELACSCGAISKEGAVVIGGQRWVGKRPEGGPSMTGAIKIWPSGPRNGSVVITLNTDAAIKSAAFSPNGRRLAVGCDDGAIVVFDLATRVALKFRGHLSMVTSVTYDPSGKWLASSSYDRTVRLWDAESGAELQAFKGHAQAALSVGFSPDGSRLVSASQDGTVRLWDTSAPPEAIKLEGISVGDGGTKAQNFSSVAWVQDITITNDGNRILLAQHRAPVRAYNAKTGALLWPKADSQGDSVVSVLLDNDKRVVGATGSGFLEWNLNTGEGGWTLKRFPVKDVLRVSADQSRAVTRSGNRKFAIHDLRSGAVIATTGEHVAPIGRPAMSTNGRRVLTLGLDLKAITWNGDTGAKVSELVGHIGMIRCGAFSPDGTRVATCGEEGVVKLWNPETGHEVLTLRFPPHIGWAIGWSADGSKLVALDFRGVAHVWDAGPPPK